MLPGSCSLDCSESSSTWERFVGAPLPEAGAASRWLRFGLSLFLVLLLAGLCAWIAVEPLLFTSWKTFIGVYLALGAGMILLLVAAPEPVQFRRGALWVFGAALLCRLLLMAHPVSEDIHRYVWEGSLVRAGETPYSAPASDPRFERFRDAHWERMNHLETPTAYPPGAELLFAAVGVFGVWGMRVLFVACDLGVLLLLLRMLNRRGMPARWALLYALNPLILMAFAAEGKFDSVHLLLIMGAVDLYETDRKGPALLLCACAVQVKIIALLLIPLFLRDGGWRKAGWLLPAVFLPVLPFMGELDRLVHGVISFGSQFSFNGTGHRLLCLLGLERSQASLAAVILLGAACVFAWRRRSALVADAGWILAALLLLSPTVHYWYLAWLIPFLVLFPSRPWILLTNSFAFYFVTVGIAIETGEWSQPMWAWLMIWAPFLIFAVWEFRHGLRRRRKRGRSGGPPWSAPRTISVVVPTWNEEARIEACLEAIAAIRPLEILVADGGSRDRTRERALSVGARVIDAVPGRGHQVRTAVEQARGDVVLVLHADAHCLPSTGERILQALTHRPDAVGGAVGQHFSGDAGRLGVLELLNDLRACILRISFGDQGQFFRREAMEGYGGYPGMALMEDVEMSLRMREAGDTLYLWRGLEVSPRDWVSAPFFARMRMVITMTLGYQLRRMFGPVDTDALYERYYGRKPGAPAE
jgi:hypothetical protein